MPLKVQKLSPQQKVALRVAWMAHLVGTQEGALVCAYGNEFFCGGGTRDHGICQRSTLHSLKKLGLIEMRPGFTLRGEARLSPAGLKLFGERMWFYVQDYTACRDELARAYELYGLLEHSAEPGRVRGCPEDADVTVKGSLEDIEIFEAWLRASGLAGLQIRGVKV